MALEDSIRIIADRLPDQLPHLETEEATKNALVMPFIAALGYNVFDPTEVVPEFTADVGVRRGEKVDYALMRDGEPIILFECKAAGVNLDEHHASQLFRYFTTTPARIGVLTNGVIYRFHADLDKANTMDMKPFLEVNLVQLDDSVLPELQRFEKGAFDVESTLEAASGLKYTREIKQILAQQLRAPEEEFVRFFAGQVYAGLKTRQVIERFTRITKASFNEFINDRVYDRLRSAIAQGGQMDDAPPSHPEEESADNSAKDQVVTTVDELEGFYAVKAILRDLVAPSRVTLRDVRAYCGVYIDDDYAKRVCRLYFNGRQKSVGLVTADNREERVAIESVDGLYDVADRLRATVQAFELG